MVIRIMNKKIIAIGTILMLLLIPIGSINAEEGEGITDQGKLFPDDLFDFENIELKDIEFEKIQEFIENLMEKIEEAKDEKEVESILDKIQKDKNSLFKKTRLEKFQKKGRSLIISYGKGLKLTNLKNNKIKLTKRLAVWHYTPENVLQGKTIIVKPRALKESRVLTGMQLGLMTKFKGIHICHKDKMIDKSFSLYIGFAKNVYAFDFSKLKLPNFNFDMPNIDLPSLS